MGAIIIIIIFLSPTQSPVMCGVILNECYWERLGYLPKQAQEKGRTGKEGQQWIGLPWEYMTTGKSGCEHLCNYEGMEDPAEPRRERATENRLVRKDDQLVIYRWGNRWLLGGYFRKRKKKSMNALPNRGNQKVTYRWESTGRLLICFTVDETCSCFMTLARSSVMYFHSSQGKSEHK